MNKKLNVGIEILRLLMCFEVIMIHYYDCSINGLINTFFIFSSLAVPIFMFLSFYLCTAQIVESRGSVLKRFKRLAIPHIFWTLFVFIVFAISNYLKITNGKNTVESLLFQLFSGHAYNAPMWFVVDLIYLTLLYMLIFKMQRKIALSVDCFLFFFSICFQYLGLNIYFFGDLRHELRFTLGRFVEMIPYASLGILFAYYDVLECLKRYRYILLPVFVAVLYLILHFQFYIPDIASYTYGGLLILSKSLLFLMIFLLIPFEKLNHRISKGICSISRFSMGIYCQHVMIANILIGFLKVRYDYDISRFVLCIIVFAIGAFTSYLISRIPITWLSKVVS